MIEAASGGTLFLDEINSMSPSLQAKLLRFLQERKVRRVGATQEIPIDLKIISSVNVPPHLAIDSGALRADLFYRLAVVYIQIPPLRDRVGDINRLTAHFLDRAGTSMGKKASGIDGDVVNRFKVYTWPGNVRELEHVIEGAMNMVGDEETIRLHHLSGPLRNWLPSRTEFAPRANEFSPTGDTAGGFKKTLPQIKTEQEFAAIDVALTNSRGCAAEAARQLGISPQLLRYKLKRHEIDRRDYLSKE